MAISWEFGYDMNQTALYQCRNRKLSFKMMTSQFCLDFDLFTVYKVLKLSTVRVILESLIQFDCTLLNILLAYCIKYRELIVTYAV